MMIKAELLAHMRSQSHHVRVKGEHVVVANTVGYVVAVQLIAEHVHGRVHLLLVLVLDGRADKFIGEFEIEEDIDDE